MAYIAGMRLPFRPFTAFALALLLALTSQSMAVARGAAGVSGSVVLCTGTGPVTILTDASGQPVGPAHICPDCTLSLILALPQTATPVAHPMGRADNLAMLPLPVIASQGTAPFSARDPPLDA